MATGDLWLAFSLERDEADLKVASEAASEQDLTLVAFTGETASVLGPRFETPMSGCPCRALQAPTLYAIAGWRCTRCAPPSTTSCSAKPDESPGDPHDEPHPSSPPRSTPGPGRPRHRPGRDHVERLRPVDAGRRRRWCLRGRMDRRSGHAGRRSGHPDQGQQPPERHAGGRGRVNVNRFTTARCC